MVGRDIDPPLVPGRFTGELGDVFRGPVEVLRGFCTAFCPFCPLVFLELGVFLVGAFAFGA